MSAAASAQPAPDAAGPETREGASLSTAFGQSDTGLWVVQLEDPSLASYTGGIAGLAPTSPRATGDRSLDVTAPASRAYLSHLADRHSDLKSQMDRALGRSVEVTSEYRNVVNGLAVRISDDEAATLAALPGVAGVYPDIEREIQTDVSNDLIGSAAFWDGLTGSGVATRGEGIVVGMLDTGVNPHHPSFAAVDGEGYVHENPFGPGNFVGVCDPDHPEHEDICNDKLIGAWNFHPSSPSAQDWNDHGSHVGGTIAGNIHEAEFTLGSETFTRTVQGVAPRANVISYLVCFPSCPATASVDAVNQAIADGVDVLNYSISGSDNPWNDLTDLAFLDAYNAGIFVSASAGNDGPFPSSVAKTGPWNASVAASTHNRIFAHVVETLGPTPVPPGIAEMPAFPGEGPQVTADIEAEVRYAGAVDPGNSEGCLAFPAGAFDDSIALIIRGGCTFVTKVINAENAGATAVLVYNHVGGPPIAMGGIDGAGTTAPAVMTDLANGDALRDFILDNAPDPTQVRINAATAMFVDDDWEDVVAAFSSRGPSQFDLLAPTYTAPGVNILAAGAESDGDPNQYAILQGTSMSSPHGAGAAALLVALHPDWSPAEVRSALAGTADPDVLVKEDGTTPADPFDQGSGRVDLDAAARVGLVMDESHANFVAANPALGGDPRTLNVPHLVDQNCVGTCSWTRTLTSVADEEASYTAQVTGADGINVTVHPASFTVPAGGTQQITVTVEVTGPGGGWTFADVRFNTDDTHANGRPIAPVHYPVVVVPQVETPSLTLDPTELTSVQAPDQVVEQTLTIGNVGGATLEWEVFSGDDPGPAPVTITHSASQDILAGNAVACSPDGGASTTENGYLRHFVLEDLGVFGDLDVTEVSFGVESASPQTVTVNLFRMIDPDGPFVYANFEPVGSADHAIDETITAIVTVPVAASVPAGSTLVVEVDTVDLSEVGRFFAGTNPAGQTAPSYLRSASCGLPEPVATGDIGFPNMHLVINVAGVTEPPACDVPGDVSWADVTPLSGQVAPGGEQAVTVTFDSTGLAPGTQSGTLCLSTNDPDSPFVVVPVTLVVEAAPAIVVSPDALQATQFAGTVTEQTLTIDNVGSADLDWVIAQAEAAGQAAPLGLDPAAFNLIQGSATGGDRAAASALAGVADLMTSGARGPAEVLPLGDVTVTGGLSEGFDNITVLPAQGWAMINNSDPLGTSDWFQGNPAVFPSHEGAGDSYIAANFLNADFIGTISNWLLTPELTLQDGDTVSFWTRAPAGSGFPDRLEVRLSTAGDSTDVGTAADSVGDFTEVLLTINPNLLVGGYPESWTEFEVTISGLETPASGRLAFRYFVTDAGPFGLNSDYIGIDTFEFTPFDSCNEPVDIPWLDVAPAAGTTTPGEGSDVTVTFDSTGLAPGEYEAQLCVDSNDPINPRVVVPVTLTVLEGVQCDRTITGLHIGPLVVSEGVTCLAEGARVIGLITVHPGAGLVSTGATVIGPVATVGASVVDLDSSRFAGSLSVTGGSELVSITGNSVVGPVSVVNNNTGDTPIVVSGNGIIGSLSCTGNQPAPVDNGVPNLVIGPKSGQCAGL